MTSFTIIAHQNAKINAKQWFKDTVGKGKWAVTAQKDKSIELNYEVGKVKFTFLEYIEPGDRLCRMILGFRTHALGLKQGNSKHVSQFVITSSMIVGVVTDTDIQSDDPRADLAYQLAAQLNALIFNGDYYVDHNGEIVLQ